MFEPSAWGKNPQGWKQTYIDKYILWTQLAGCVGLFGSIFAFISEHSLFGAHHHYLSIPMVIIGVILCTFNWAVDPM